MKTFVIHDQYKILGDLYRMYHRSRVSGLCPFSLTGMFPLPLEVYEKAHYLNITISDTKAFNEIWQYLNGDNTAIIPFASEYKLLSIAAYNHIGLTQKEKNRVSSGVRDVWGPVSLHPIIVRSFVDDESKIPAAMDMIIGEIVLAERKICGYYIDQYNKEKGLDAPTDKILSESMSEVFSGSMGYGLPPESKPEVAEYPHNYYTTSVISRIDRCTPIPIKALESLDFNIFGEDATYRKRISGTPNPMYKVSEKIVQLLRLNDGEFNPHTAIVVINSKYEYCGHVWIWPNLLRLKHANVIGIRSSMANLACKLLTNVSLKIFQGVAMWSKKYNFSWIEIIIPLEVMAKILQTKLGFIYKDGNLISATDSLLLKYQEGLSELDDIGDKYWIVMRVLLDSPEFQEDLPLMVSPSNDMDVWLRKSMNVTQGQLLGCVFFVLQYSPLTYVNVSDPRHFVMSLQSYLNASRENTPHW